jgi:hypothetical protein
VDALPASVVKEPAAVWPRLHPAAAGALLVVLVLLLHWPGGADFKSDDFFAIRYASDWRHVAHDFAGSQYDLEFLVFWRPLITLSFAVDHALFGTAPFGFYLMNALALLAAALLVLAIFVTLRPGPLGTWLGLACAALWVAHPILVPSLRWVAGRVDTHVAPPLLLALLLHLRLRRGGRAWPVWICALVAVATKESAIGFPLLALGLDLLDPQPSLRPASAFAGRALPALPYLWLVPVFFAWRKVVLGTFLGGYGFLAQAAIDPLAMAAGLWHSLGATLMPGARMAAAVALVVVLAGLLWLLLHERGARLVRSAGAGLLLAGLYGPLAQVLPSMRSGDQRYAYLACAGVVSAWVMVVLGLGRRWPLPALVLAVSPLAWLVPAHFAAKRDMAAHDAFNTGLRRAIAECDARLGDGEPVVIGGDTARAYHPYRLLWGLAEVHGPPFAARRREVVTLQPLRAGLRAPSPSDAAGTAWVRIDGESCRVEPGEAAGRRRAPAQGFDGLLDEPHLTAIAEGAAGWEVGPGFDGTVAMCTPVGSLLLSVGAEQLGDGRLRLRDVLLQPDVHVIQLLWNALDLAPSSQVWLSWRETAGARVASFGVSRAFTRALTGLLRGE